MTDLINPVASVTVTPAAADVAAGNTVRLTATLQDSAGNTLNDRLVVWTTSNPFVANVDTTGLVTAFAEGSARITANSGTNSGTSAITVTPDSGSAGATTVGEDTLPGKVIDLSVNGTTDSSVTLAFTEVTDGTGKPASYDVRFGPAPISWGSALPSVTRGTCATPLAGSAIGVTQTCTVRGLQPATTYEFQLVAFRGTLQVDAAFGELSNIPRTETSPSTAASDGSPEPQPTGSVVFQDGFESGNVGLWVQAPNTGRYSVSSNPARVKSGAHSLEVLFTPTNSYGVLTRWFNPGYDEISVKFHVMFEEDFVNPGMHFHVLAGNRIDNQSSSMGRAGVVPNGTDYFYAGVDPEYNTQDPILRPFHFYTYWPDMSCCYGNRFYQTTPKSPLLGGRWHEIVFHIKLNTPGQSNGSQTLWIDGVKKIDVQNMRWRTTTDLRLNQIRFDNWMQSSPKIQHIWVDDVVVWTQ